MHTTLAPAMSASFSVIAERFRRAGQMDRAVALCREGLEAYPEHLSARVTLGCALLDLGQHIEAHRELQAVLKRAPDNLAAIRGLAELHARGLDEQDVHDMQDAHDLQIAHERQVAEAEQSAADHLAEAQPVVAEPDIAPLPAFEAQPEPMLDAAPEPLFDAEPAAMLIEELDPVMPAEPMAALGIVPIDVLPLDDFDPPVELARAEPLQFEIEDVLEEAGDGFDFGDEAEASLEFDLGSESGPESDFDIDPVMPAPSARPADPIPVPELSTGPIAVLDEWLTRIRARRSELLSEYAAS